MSRSLRIAAAALAVAAPALAHAQRPAAVAQPSNTQEFGLDAGAVIALGNQSGFQIRLPASRARVGFFLNNDSRWSIEPAAGLTYTKVKDEKGVLTYDLEAGALYHFRAPSSLTRATGRTTVTYVRPFVGINGFSGGGSDNEFTFGAGLGAKVPVRSDVALRAEANLGYGTTSKAARIGLNLGLSLFTRNVL